MEIAPVGQRDVDRRPTERLRGIESTESAAEDDNLMRPYFIMIEMESATLAR